MPRGIPVDPRDSLLPGVKHSTMPRADGLLGEVMSGNEPCRGHARVEITGGHRWTGQIEPGHRLLSNPQFDHLLKHFRFPIELLSQFTAEAVHR